jgi:Mg2+ and Co2+ transporter CorA
VRSVGELIVEATGVEPLRLRSVTVWSDRGCDRYRGDAARPGASVAQEIAHAAHRGPVWLDVEVGSDVDEWMDPWDSPTACRVDWSALSDVAELLGFDLPDPTASPATSATASVLGSLRYVNEFGVLRWVTDADRDGATPPLVMPVAGFVPAHTLRPAGDHVADGLEFVLVRVNMAAVENRLFTFRLTDRLCSGTRREAERRIAAAEHYSSPKLTVFQRFLPPGRAPTADDLGEALAGYLAATCSSVSECARRRLRAIEREVFAFSRDASAEAADATAENMASSYREVLTIRGTLETAEEELVRLLQRLSDIEEAAGPRLARVRNRYEEGLVELRSVEVELRWAGDAAANRIATLALQQQREAERRAGLAQERADERQKKLESVIAGLGTAIVIAALVPSLFTDNVKLPTQEDRAFVGMVLIMLGAAGLVFWALLTLFSHKAAPAPDASSNGDGRRVRWWLVASNTVALATIAAGVAVLLWAG